MPPAFIYSKFCTNPLCYCAIPSVVAKLLSNNAINKGLCYLICPKRLVLSIHLLFLLSTLRWSLQVLCTMLVIKHIKQHKNNNYHIQFTYFFSKTVHTGFESLADGWTKHGV